MSGVHSDSFEGVVVGVPSSFRIIIQHKATHAAYTFIPACIRIPSAEDEALSYAAKDLIRRQFMGYAVSVTHVKDHARIRRIQDGLDLTTSLMKNGLAWCHEGDRVYNEFHDHKASLLELQNVAKRRAIGVHDPCIRTSTTLRTFRPLPQSKDPYRQTTINSVVATRGVMRFSVERVHSCCSFSGFIPQCGQLISVRLIGFSPPSRESAAKLATNKVSAKLLHRIVSVLVYDFDTETDEFIVELTSVQNNKLIKELFDTGFLTPMSKQITNAAAAEFDAAFFSALSANRSIEAPPAQSNGSSSPPLAANSSPLIAAGTVSQTESPKLASHSRTSAPLAVDADEGDIIQSSSSSSAEASPSLSPEDNIDLSLEALTAELAGEIHFDPLDAIGQAFGTPSHSAGVPSPQVHAAAITTGSAALAGTIGGGILGAGLLPDDASALPPPTEDLWDFDRPKTIPDLPLNYGKARNGIVIGVRNEVTLDVVETRVLRTKGVVSKERVFYKMRLDGTRAPFDIVSEPSTHASTLLNLDRHSFHTREALRRFSIGKSVTFFLRGRSSGNSDKSTSALVYMPISETNTVAQSVGTTNAFVDLAGTVRSILGVTGDTLREGSGGSTYQSESSPDRVGDSLSPTSAHEDPTEPIDLVPLNNDDVVSQEVADEATVGQQPEEEEEAPSPIDPNQYCLLPGDSLFLPPLESMTHSDRQLADFGAMLCRGAATNDELVKILCGGWDVPAERNIEETTYNNDQEDAAHQLQPQEEERREDHSETSSDSPLTKKDDIPINEQHQLNEDEEPGVVVMDGTGEHHNHLDDRPTVSIDVVDNDGVQARIVTFHEMITETLMDRDADAVIEEFDPVTLNFSIFFPEIGIQCPFQLPEFVRLPKYSIDTHGFPQAHIDIFYEMYEFLEDTVVHRDCVLHCSSVNAEKGCISGSISMQIDQLPRRWAERLGVVEVLADYKAACEDVMRVREDLIRGPEDLSSKLDRESEEYNDEDIAENLPPFPLPPVLDLLGMLASLGYTAVVPAKITQRMPLPITMNVLCRQETARVQKAGVWAFKATSKLFRHCGMGEVDRAFERCSETYPDINTSLKPEDPAPSARAGTRIVPLAACGMLSFLYRETGPAYVDAYDRMQEVLKREAMPMRERRVYAGDAVVLRLSQPLPGTELTERVATRGPPRPADADDSDAATASADGGPFYYRGILTTKVYRRKALMVDVNLVDFLHDKPISILLRDVRLPDNKGIVEGQSSLLKRARHSFLTPRTTAFEFLHSTGNDDNALYEYYPDPIPPCHDIQPLRKVTLAALRKERLVLQESLEGLCELPTAYISNDYTTSTDIVVKCDPCTRENDVGANRGVYICGCVFADDGDGPSLILPPASLSLLMKCPNLIKVDTELVNHSVAFTPTVTQLLRMSQVPLADE